MNSKVARREPQKWALSTEAVDAFSRILGSSLSQVVVSAQDLQAVIQSNNFFRCIPQQSENCPQVSRHPRPTQANAYVPPVRRLNKVLPIFGKTHWY